MNELELVSKYPWLGVGISITVALVSGLALQWLIARLLLRVTHENTLVGAMARGARGPMHVLVPLLAVQFALTAAPDELALIDTLRRVSALAMIIALTRLAIRMVAAASDAMVSQHPVSAADNYEARRIQTQSKVLGRTLIFIVGIVGFSVALMTFPAARSVGTSLLASAGIAGLAVGLAAKSVLGNLMAGVQLAITQPLRIDDVLIINGEYGRVEEINGTYVVMRLWDERRQIVPLQWFIENPFENWTRRSSQLLGTVLLWVDYRMPIEPLRVELARLCEQAPEWDRRVCGLQVTDASDVAVQIRALVSAVDSGKTFDLRCRIREGLLAYINSEHAIGLPTRRSQWSSLVEAGENPSAGSLVAATGTDTVATG